MKRRSRIALLWLAVVLLAGCEATGDEAAAPDAWVTIRDARVAVEVVVNPKDQARGLGYRDSLAWDHGMLFEYDRPRFLSFWMKGMRFDLDIVWLRDERIVDIDHRVPWVESPNGPWPPISPASMVDLVLEVPAGYASSHGWRTGDRIRIERATRPAS